MSGREKSRGRGGEKKPGVFGRIVPCLIMGTKRLVPIELAQRGSSTQGGGGDGQQGRSGPVDARTPGAHFLWAALTAALCSFFSAARLWTKAWYSEMVSFWAKVLLFCKLRKCLLLCNLMGVTSLWILGALV